MGYVLKNWLSISTVSTLDPKELVKPTEEEPKLGINSSKLFGNASGGFMPLDNS